MRKNSQLSKQIRSIGEGSLANVSLIRRRYEMVHRNRVLGSGGDHLADRWMLLHHAVPWLRSQKLFSKNASSQSSAPSPESTSERSKPDLLAECRMF